MAYDFSMTQAKAKLSREDIEAIRERATRAVEPLRPADRSKKYAIGTDRTRAGQTLPEHYLVYFLLVELLRFPHGGHGEKVAWTVPVDYEGSCAVIAHR